MSVRRRSHRRGILTLSATMGLILLLVLLDWLLYAQLDRARTAVVGEKARLAADTLARSGLDYARVRGLRGRFVSPPLDGRGYFVVTVAGGRIRSTGVCTESHPATECTMGAAP